MRYICIIAFTGSLVGSSNPVHRSSPVIRDGHEWVLYNRVQQLSLYRFHSSGKTVSGHCYQVLHLGFCVATSADHRVAILGS